MTTDDIKVLSGIIEEIEQGLFKNQETIAFTLKALLENSKETSLEQLILDRNKALEDYGYCLEKHKKLGEDRFTCRYFPPSKATIDAGNYYNTLNQRLITHFKKLLVGPNLERKINT